MIQRSFTHFEVRKDAKTILRRPSIIFPITLDVLRTNLASKLRQGFPRTQEPRQSAEWPICINYSKYAVLCDFSAAVTDRGRLVQFTKCCERVGLVGPGVLLSESIRRGHKSA